MFATRLKPPAPVSRDSSVADRVATGLPPVPAIIFVLAHIPLAFLMQSRSLIAYAHGFTTFAIGMWWALSSNRLHRVAWVAAYVIGSEVLWRMTTDALPWESGKYMIAALSIAGLLNTRGF